MPEGDEPTLLQMFFAPVGGQCDDRPGRADQHVPHHFATNGLYRLDTKLALKHSSILRDSVQG
jgi:hypothetical protein